MTRRRDFIIGSGAMMGLAAVSPTLIAASDERALSAAEPLHTFPSKRWLALYDGNGNYLTDVKLVSTDEDASSASVNQFSLVWESRSRGRVSAGMYMIDDFETEPKAIYLEPTDIDDRNRSYRASFSLLK